MHFSSMGIAYCILSKNLCQPQSHKDLFLKISLNVVLTFKFNLTIYFVLFLCAYHMALRFRYFHIIIQFSQSHFLKRLSILH